MYDRVVNQLDGNLLVNTSLQTLMNETDADRAYVFRFHNGDAYYNGTHKNKFSCDYEVVKLGVERQAQRLQNIPVTLYPEFISQVIDNEMYYTDIDKIESIVLKSALKEQGIKSIAVAPYFRNGHLFAMIGVDYLTNTSDKSIIDFNENSQNKINWFTNTVNQIGNLLE
jgi:hypothetical protein